MPKTLLLTSKERKISTVIYWSSPCTHTHARIQIVCGDKKIDVAGNIIILPGSNKYNLVTKSPGVSGFQKVAGFINNSTTMGSAVITKQSV